MFSATRRGALTAKFRIARAFPLPCAIDDARRTQLGTYPPGIAAFLFSGQEGFFIEGTVPAFE